MLYLLNLSSLLYLYFHQLHFARSLDLALCVRNPKIVFGTSHIFFCTCHPLAPFLLLMCHPATICHSMFLSIYHSLFLSHVISFHFPSTSIFHPSFDWSSVVSFLEHPPQQYLSQPCQPPVPSHEKWLFDTFSHLLEKYGVLHIFKSARLC